MRRPIRLGLIGCGGIVQGTHAARYRTMPQLVEVTALADPVEASREAVGAAFDVPPTNRHADYRDMLAAGNLDAAMIATPHSLHREHAVEAAKAGVAVISEKPMAVSLDEADAILEAVERANVFYAVSHNLLFSPAMLDARRKLSDGALGDPIIGRAQSLFLKSAPLARDDWRHRKETGGGCVIDTAYHEIYSVEALMRSPVRYVEARVKTSLFDIDADDTAILLLEHENAAVSTVTSTWCAAAMGTERGRWCEVHGTGGSLRVYHRADEPAARFHRQGGWRTEIRAQEDPTGHAGFFRATFEALIDDAPPPVSGQDARHDLAIIEAARRASVERRAIEAD